MRKATKQKVFSFNRSTPLIPEDYVGYEVVKELTKMCSSIYSEGPSLVAVLNNGEVKRVTRTGDFLKTYRDMLELLKGEKK